METSDIIAVVAAVMAFGSVCVSAWALIYARRQAEIADKALTESRRAATAGEKSADAADIAAQEAKRSADAAEESNRIALRALELSEPPPVAWTIELAARNSAYLLRNVGTQTATGVTVDQSRITTTARALPDGATIAAGEAVRFMALNAPNTLFLTWDGQPEPAAVPVPPDTRRPIAINRRA
ncbi:hypothetical protein [Nocardia grenadensis]|uniref:hypothetical protein n=1 Tax=Nocardia grenadensis TaxID=931537 RepID=UPI0007A53D96|nr:hypothetical protein [Nocardia grenadensis]